MFVTFTVQSFEYGNPVLFTMHHHQLNIVSICIMK